MATTGRARSHTPQGSRNPPENSSSSSSPSYQRTTKPSTMPSSPTDTQYRGLVASPPSPATHACSLHRNSTDSDIASWQMPVDIDDADLTFDGKPLNLLHEENQSRWMLEHRVFGEAGSESVPARGRSREVDWSRRKGGDNRAARTSKT